MTKNKTLAIVLSVVFVLVLVVALGQSVFRVGAVELVAHSTTNHLSGLNESTVLTNSNLSKGKSVFLLDREEYKKNLEKNLPYMHVLAVEVAWPNTVRFHYTEREEMYVMALKDGSYAYLDRDLKILKISSGAYNTTQQNPILIDDDVDLISDDLTVGEFLDATKFIHYIGLGAAYENIGYTATQFKSMVSTIHTEEVDGGVVLVMDTYLGVQIKILNSGYYTDAKVNLAYGTLEELDSTERTTGAIYVFKNSQSVLESRYIA